MVKFFQNSLLIAKKAQAGLPAITYNCIRALLTTFLYKYSETVVLKKFVSDFGSKFYLFYLFSAAAEITRLGVTNPTKADEINKSVDQLFASNHPQPNSKPRSKNSRKISKNRLYSSKNDEPGRAVKTSFKSSRANLKSLKSNASKSKIPSFSRPGIGLQRRASNLMAEKTGMNKTSNRSEITKKKVYG